MKTEQEILDEFGQRLVTYVFDRGVANTQRYSLEEIKNFDSFKKLFGEVTEEKKLALEKKYLV